RDHPRQLRRCLDGDRSLAGRGRRQPAAGLENQAAHRVSCWAEASRLRRESGGNPSWASSASARESVGPGANSDNTDHGTGTGGGFRPSASMALACPVGPVSLSMPYRTPVSAIQNSDPAGGEDASWPTV